jgi:hypothetical protein
MLSEVRLRLVVHLVNEARVIPICYGLSVCTCRECLNRVTPCVKNKRTIYLSPIRYGTISAVHICTILTWAANRGIRNE